MSVTRAELLKLSRSALPWVVGSLCVLAYMLLFAIYCLRSSSVFEPELLVPGRFTSLLLGAFIGLLNVIPAVLIGCYIGAADYGSRTAGTTVHWGGRYGPLMGKLSATAVILCFFVIATGLLGLLTGLILNANLAGIELTLLMQQLLIAMVATAMLGLLALAVATLTRSLAAANLICLVALLAQAFLPPPMSGILSYINPLTLVAGLAGPAFTNLSSLRNISLSFASDLTLIQSVAGTVGYVGCCLGVLILVARRREYR